MRKLWFLLLILFSIVFVLMIQLHGTLQRRSPMVVRTVKVDQNYIAKIALLEAILNGGEKDPRVCLEEALSEQYDFPEEYNSTGYFEFKNATKLKFEKCKLKYNRTIINSPTKANKVDRIMWRRYWETNANVTYCNVNETELHRTINITFATIPPTYQDLEEMYPDVYHGGFYPGPEDCAPIHSTVIIIPYRDRDTHLRYWLQYMIRIFMEQKIRFLVVVVEQEGRGVFNKGQIMNTGFKWAKERTPNKWDCYVFHDVDMISEVPSNMYTCNKDSIKHYTPYTQKFKYSMKNTGVTIGGAVGMTGEQYEAVNGYSNYFYGWGGEDDDMYARIINKKYKIVRPKNPDQGKYTMVKHERDEQNPNNPQRHRLLKTSKKRMGVDGANSLPTEISVVLQYALYTKVKVKIMEKENFNMDEMEANL